MKVFENSSSTFSMAGWLFADMFLGLAMIFLLANTWVPKKESTPTITATSTLKITNTPSTIASSTPTMTITSTPLPTPLVGLDLTPLRFSILVDPDKLISNNRKEIISLNQSFASQLRNYQNKRAGLVITLGYHTSGNIAFAREFADKANDILCQNYTNIFNCSFDQSGTVLKTFWWDTNLNKPIGTLDFEIYFFNR